ncbi:MAG: FadR family transcriptional regulator [Melioribacteraceae bacterium]|nr:FadR family transcriptional regulator [Melioribacteraceae bacterium]
MFTALEQREPISKKIVAIIEESILDKTFKAGEKLPSEAELCVQFGVSRTSIREAIQKLSAHGLVTIIKGKGIYVNKISSESVTVPFIKYLQHKLSDGYFKDLIEARNVLEPAIAALAAANHTEDDIEKLETDIEELKLATDPKEHSKWDMQFHYDLAKASKNSIIPILLKPIQEIMPDIKSVILDKVKDAHNSALEWHTNILKAVKANDPEAARTAMIEHLKRAKQDIDAIINDNK